MGTSAKDSLPFNPPKNLSRPFRSVFRDNVSTSWRLVIFDAFGSRCLYNDFYCKRCRERWNTSARSKLAQLGHGLSSRYRERDFPTIIDKIVRNLLSRDFLIWLSAFLRRTALFGCGI